MALFFLLVTPVVLLFTAPLVIEWQEAAPYWGSMFPTLGWWMGVAPGVWVVVFLVWGNVLNAYLLRRRADKRKQEAAERKEAMKLSVKQAAPHKEQPVVESQSAVEVETPQQAVALIEDVSSIQRTQEALAVEAKASVDSALAGLEYSKLEAKVVCNGLSHSHGVVRLASFKRKFYLLDHKGRRIIKMLGASSLDAAKTEMLG